MIATLGQSLATSATASEPVWIAWRVRDWLLRVCRLCGGIARRTIVAIARLVMAVTVGILALSGINLRARNIRTIALFRATITR